jgi:hypothetical protein
VGLLHSASGTVSLDIDNVEHTKIIFKELGLDYDKIMDSAPRIVGRSDRAKAIFKAPHNNLTTKYIGRPHAYIFVPRPHSRLDTLHPLYPSLLPGIQGQLQRKDGKATQGHIS